MTNLPQEAVEELAQRLYEADERRLGFSGRRLDRAGNGPQRTYRARARQHLEAAAPFIAARRDQEWREALSEHLLGSGTASELAAIRKPEKAQVALFGQLEDVNEALAKVPLAPESVEEPECNCSPGLPHAGDYGKATTACCPVHHPRCHECGHKLGEHHGPGCKTGDSTVIGNSVVRRLVNEDHCNPPEAPRG